MGVDRERTVLGPLICGAVGRTLLLLTVAGSGGNMGLT